MPRRTGPTGSGFICIYLHSLAVWTGLAVILSQGALAGRRVVLAAVGGRGCSTRLALSLGVSVEVG